MLNLTTSDRQLLIALLRQETAASTANLKELERKLRNGDAESAGGAHEKRAGTQDESEFGTTPRALPPTDAVRLALRGFGKPARHQDLLGWLAQHHVTITTTDTVGRALTGALGREHEARNIRKVSGSRGGSYWALTKQGEEIANALNS